MPRTQLWGGGTVLRTLDRLRLRAVRIPTPDGASRSQERFVVPHRLPSRKNGHIVEEASLMGSNVVRLGEVPNGG